MTILTVHHITTYSYRQAVSFGEHRIMFRPRDSHDQRLLDARLLIAPEPRAVRWVHDVFGNCVAVARFDRRAPKLRFDCIICLDHRPVAAEAVELDEYAAVYPFAYDAGEVPDLARFIERRYADPEGVMERWARRFVAPGEDTYTPTWDMLSRMTRAIKEEFVYVARTEPGIQPPLTTLALGTGSCRDFALFMMEAVRSLGLAARYISGYLYVPRKPTRTRIGGGATHAWLEVYLAGAGWIEFDPTNGIVGNQDLIRVAVTRDPQQATPIAGTWTGLPTDSLGMTVEVNVISDEGSAAVPGALSPYLVSRA
jgi:transglutaminase-like putative cysteine protease